MKDIFINSTVFMLAMFVTTLQIGLASLICGIPIYYLWNWLMPEIFGLPVITHWQAAGFSALSSCLFILNGTLLNFMTPESFEEENNEDKREE